MVFIVSPSATTKPASLAKASNGAIIQGRPDDVGVIQVGKTADFRTVQSMIQDLTQRLSDAFLILNVRQSERTTATEVQAVQQELNEQLGNIFGSLTIELLTPYLNRKLFLLQRSKSMPSLPKGLVMPTVVAGLGGVGRGQDKAALIEFVQTIAQAMGPEALAQYLDAGEFLKRLAASSGIDALNLVKTPETMAQEAEQMKQDAAQASLLQQAGQLAKTPMAEEMMGQMMQQQQDDGTQPQEALNPGSRPTGAPASLTVSSREITLQPQTSTKHGSPLMWPLPFPRRNTPRPRRSAASPTIPPVSIARPPRSTAPALVKLTPPTTNGYYHI